jgi:hypothetical protein
MSRSSLRRLGTAAASAAVLAAVAAPSPALAGDFFFSKSSGTQVSTTWLEIGDDRDALPGNAHFGDMFVDDLGNGRAFVFGTIYDVQCDAGVDPYFPGGGGHGEPAPIDGPCDLLGVRFLDAKQVTFTVDRKLTKATLTGTLAVGSEHGGVTGTPKVNITWTSVGPAYTSRESGTFEDETGTFSYRFVFTGRDAVVTPAKSFIGGMVFDDEAGEESYAQLGKYRNSERQRS